MSKSVLTDVAVPTAPPSVQCPSGCKNAKGRPQYLAFVTGLTEDGVPTAWARCQHCKKTRCPNGHAMVEVWAFGISSYKSEPHNIKVCVAPGCQRVFNEMTESADQFRYQNLSTRSAELLKLWQERARGSRNWRDVQAQMMVNLWAFWGTPVPVEVVHQQPARTDRVSEQWTVEDVLAMVAEPVVESAPSAQAPLSVDELARSMSQAPPGIDYGVAADMATRA